MLDTQDIRILDLDDTRDLKPTELYDCTEKAIDEIACLAVLFNVAFDNTRPFESLTAILKAATALKTAYDNNPFTAQGGYSTIGAGGGAGGTSVASGGGAGQSAQQWDQATLDMLRKMQQDQAAHRYQQQLQQGNYHDALQNQLQNAKWI